MYNFVFGLLFVIQFVLFVIAMIKKGKPKWDLLLKTQMLSLICLIAYFVIYTFLDNDGLLESIAVILSCVLYGAAYLVAFVVSLLFRSKNQVITIENGIKKVQFILFAFIIFLVLITISIEIKPYIKTNNEQKEYSKYIVEYMTSKYGDGEYKVINVKDNEVCTFVCTSGTYTFEMTSKYLNNSFTMEVEKDTKELVYDGFISEYVKQNKWCEEKKLIHPICNLMESSNWQYTYFDNSAEYSIEIYTPYIEDYKNIKYGRLPNIDDLKKQINIRFTKFDIIKVFSSEEQLKAFMIGIYREYLKGYNCEESGMIIFNFKNGNPFAEDDAAYKNGGYLKEDSDNLYIYYRKKPIIIAKSSID